ncbi:MAG TPA: PhzF family phenazine biosynthesis protein [Tepidisphaeraceae bacterium]|jgi:PhzF family phenazine biosynthesis protein
MDSNFFHVDAFTDAAFRGNPAAVVLLDTPRDAFWMQRLAAEMNLSETAFVSPQGAQFGLRWFTPLAEVELCGHATLASAHALWEAGVVARGEISFATRSGLLRAVSTEDGIELDFPSKPASEAPEPAGLAEALRTTIQYRGRNAFDHLVEVGSEHTLRNLNPDMLALGRLQCRGIIATASASGSQYDFVSRFFAPSVGIDEDPVTGSAHCCLAPFWAARLGKTEMLGYQASARGGSIRVRLAGDRVYLIGKATTIVRGNVLC